MKSIDCPYQLLSRTTCSTNDGASKHITQSAHPGLSLLLVFLWEPPWVKNPFDYIAHTSLSGLAYEQPPLLVARHPVSYLILFLILFAIVISNFMKSGNTPLYAHADPDDGLVVN